MTRAPKLTVLTAVVGALLALEEGAEEALGVDLLHGVAVGAEDDGGRLGLREEGAEVLQQGLRRYGW